MIQKSYTYINCLLLAMFLFCSQAAQAEDLPKLSGDQILERMIETTKSVKTAIYRLDKIERIKDKLVEESLFIKLSVKPFKIYTRMYSPKEGMEVLYNSEWEKKKAIINTNSFPWVNVRFNPMSKTMRKDQHHTLLDSGFEKIVSCIEFQYRSFTSEGKEMTENKGEISVDGKPCWILEFQDPDFKLVDYVVKDGENLVQIAKNLKLSDYMILESNRDIKNYDDVEAGQLIKVPSSYSKRMVLYVDQQGYMPLKVEVYDAKGLYEQFDFKEMKLNVQFKANEFSADFEEYDF